MAERRAPADSPLATSEGVVERALVVGLGVSGAAAVEALRDVGVAVRAVERSPDASGVARARAAGAEVDIGAAPEERLEGIDLVVPSPGVPEHAPVLQRALAAGTPVWSEPELGWRVAPRRLVGVTGTNGKTSTTQLTAAMLAAAGLDARACGNIGEPVTAAARATAPATVLVAELSSFQLRFCHALRPEVGVLLNLAPDHLDWHGGFDAYAAAKARLWRAQKPGDWAVVNADDPAVVAAAEDVRAGVASFAGGRVPRPGVGWVGDLLTADLPQVDGPLLSADDLTLDAPHHRANVAAAALAALLCGADPAAVAEAATAFRVGAHRLEPVVERRGVRWIDDSKATNPHAAAAALAAFDRVVWIAGGQAKGVDLGALATSLDGVRAAVLLGEAADALARVCDAAGVPTVRAGDIRRAVRLAADRARPGDVVLLAPACASFDQFRDYADRGEQFAAAARSLDADPAAATPGSPTHG